MRPLARGCCCPFALSAISLRTRGACSAGYGPSDAPCLIAAPSLVRAVCALAVRGTFRRACHAPRGRAIGTQGALLAQSTAHRRLLRPLRQEGGCSSSRQGVWLGLGPVRRPHHQVAGGGGPFHLEAVG